MSAGFICNACQGIFKEPDEHKNHGDSLIGEAYWVIEQFCPDCGDDNIQEVSVCENCEVFEAEPGEDECRSCLDELAVCAGEFAYDCKRDTVEEVKPLIKESA